MSVANRTIERIFAKIDRDELAHLAMSLADFFSPPGYERDIANFIFNWFEENGLHPLRQEIESERYNAIGVLRGSGGGPSLMLNGHLDTSVSSKSVVSAYESNGLVHGHEIANMKAGLATIMVAVKAIKEAGVQLKGDLIVATVAGEISVAPVGRFQGRQDRGEGIGTRHLLANGIWSDYAIVADGSAYAIVRAQPGAAYFRIATKGAEYYSPIAKQPEGNEQSQNAIVKMAEVIRALEDWSHDYERRAVYEFIGGRMEPKSVITEIEGGLQSLIREGWQEPFHRSWTPASCNLYLDVRIPPNFSPIEIKHKLEEFLNRLPFELEIEMFRSQRGYEGKGPETDYLCSIIEKSYQTVFKSKPPSPSVRTSSMWTDTNCYWEVGIPAVKWGPSETHKYPDVRTAEVSGMVQATKVYSLVALEICGETGE